MENIKGIFDGVNMITEDGESYPVPDNYASKSKLLEGDGMELKISADGDYYYKIVNTIHRIRAIANIIKEDDQLFVFYDNKKYKLNASVISYYELKEGSKVMAVLPKFKKAKWAAIEGKIK